MTTSPLVRWLMALVLIATINCAAAEKNPAPKVVELGNNTYSVTATANDKFTRNTDKLKDQAGEVANEYCAKQGKHLKIISVKENKGLYLVGDYASATIIFKALDLADPEMSAQTGGAKADSPGAPVTNEQLYADLLRLDDLHKKGILTDAEFAAEKKKVLERSK
jgi:Short C-terminal domain